MHASNTSEPELGGSSKLEEIRLTAEHRLRQLQPVVEEVARLRDVLKVIEDPSTQPNGAAPPDNGHSVKPTTRAAKGSNKRAILALVEAHPGITVTEIVELTGMKQTVVASTVSRLKRNGELRAHKQGGVCLPPGERPAGLDRRRRPLTGV
jgi:DNA-binding transcriptional ArsR family regulator